MRRATDSSMDLNEIGITDAVANLKFNMRCPKLGDLGHTGFNWTQDQCVLRVRLNNPCVKNCVFGRKLKAALDARGEDYTLEAFPGIVVAQKTKGKSKAKVLPNSKWPGANKERNIKIAVELLEGATVLALAERYEIDRTSVRKLIYNYLEVANRSVFLSCPQKTNRADYFRLNKAFFLPALVYDKSEPALKGV